MFQAQHERDQVSSLTACADTKSTFAPLEQLSLSNVAIAYVWRDQLILEVAENPLLEG